MNSVEEWKSNRVHIGLCNSRELLYLSGFDSEVIEPIFRLVVFTDEKHPFVSPAEGVLSPDIQLVQCSIQDDVVLQDFFAPKSNRLAKSRMILFCAERYLLAFDTYAEVNEQFAMCNVSKAVKVLKHLNKYELHKQPQRICHFFLNEKELRIYSRMSGRSTFFTIPVVTSADRMKRWLQSYSDASSSSKSFKEFIKEQTVFDLPLNEVYTVEKVKDSPVYQITHKLDPDVSIMFLSTELVYLFDTLKEYGKQELIKAFAALGQ